jgi:glycosyltransferase involved in cell wall biosynthesis
MRLFYFYPSADRPAGGLKQIRLQASLLASLGYQVYLLRDDNFFREPERYEDHHYYNVDIPVWPNPFHNAIGELFDSDALILPEFALNTILPICASSSARIVIYNQNGFYAVKYAPTDRSLLKRIDLVIAISPYICNVSQVAYHLPEERVFYVPVWVVRENFDTNLIPAFDAKKLGVCYMPRKRAELVHTIRKKVQASRPDVPWIEVDNLNETGVANLLRSYKMFFAAHHLEGCPLTALEAMACGCVVAGFAGTERFRHPYATSANGYWAAKDDDVESAVQCACRMIDDVQSNPIKTKSLLADSSRTVERYSKPQVIDSLSRLMRGLDLISSGNFSKTVLSKARGSSVPEERWSMNDWLYTHRKRRHYR